jgi:hypothetical protein
VKENTFAACIIALGLIIAAILHGGIYQLQRGPGNGEWVFRMNRLTGVLSICAVDSGCRVISQGGQPSTEPSATPTDFMKGMVPENTPK